MRAVVQRVTSARIEVDGKIVSEIGDGLLVLVGLLDSDTDVDSEFICRKILNMRLFQNEKTGKSWDQNVMQKNYEVLLVSQFTLYGVLKGNKPDFHVAMPPQLAKSFYESLVQRVRKAYKPDAVKDGVFGAMMQVSLVNDGPVTMNLDSRKESSAESGISNDFLKKSSAKNAVQSPKCNTPQKVAQAKLSLKVHHFGARIRQINSSVIPWILPRGAYHSACRMLKY
ncbi:uncharacterized protein [Physcomitrium patens]|uniref:uncharacterized protein isoform X1 n=1 Tax=Physcomitrium patens TaxID=3218 RepID=UPI000D15AED7|nr:D-aminoacyl-tRNA deacylase-like isoform X1 [Physcomitrium patens]|eukprot:XP_024366261.1 D-aminoacyl-tRNA deacylase-like isoform X1 [Physcomitrella patens]